MSFPISTIEMERWNAHQRAHCRHTDKTERQQKIIELSKTGMTLKDIHSEVGGTFDVVVAIRMSARRKGQI